MNEIRPKQKNFCLKPVKKINNKNSYGRKPDFKYTRADKNVKLFQLRAGRVNLGKS